MISDTTISPFSLILIGFLNKIQKILVEKSSNAKQIKSDFYLEN